MKLVSQSKIHNLIVQLVVMIDVTQYVSILGCLHRFDYNAVLAMGLLYWFHLDKMLIQSVKMARVLVWTTCIIDVVYIVITIYALLTQADPYFGAVKGLRIFSIVLALLEIFLKVILGIRLRVELPQPTHNM